MRTLNQSADVMGDIEIECELSALEQQTARASAASEAAKVLASGGSAFMEEAKKS